MRVNLNVVFSAVLFVGFLGAGSNPENSLANLGLKQGLYFYALKDEVGIESTGIAAPCRELTQEVLDEYVLKFKCEKRKWYDVDYDYCTEDHESLLIFEKLKDCARNRQQYLETEG